MFGSGITMLTIYNEEINGIKKIAKSLEVTSLLMKGVSEIIKDEAKNLKGGFLTILSGTLGAGLLAKLLTGEGTIRAGQDI